MKVHKEDNVLVIAGKDKGKRGRVRQVFPDKNRLIVEGVNVMRKHTRGQRGARQAGIIEVEAPLNASNVMVICAKCNKPGRVAHTFLADGSKARSCRNCNELLDRDPDRPWTR